MGAEGVEARRPAIAKGSLGEWASRRVNIECAECRSVSVGVELSRWAFAEARRRGWF